VDVVAGLGVVEGGGSAGAVVVVGAAGAGAEELDVGFVLVSRVLTGRLLRRGKTTGLVLEDEEPVVGAAALDGGEPGVVVVTTPSGPNTVCESVVALLDSLVLGSAGAGEKVEPVSATTTVLVMAMVTTVSGGEPVAGEPVPDEGKKTPTDPPVATRAPLGNTPLALAPSGFVWRFDEDDDEDEDEASCGAIGTDDDPAGVVCGTLLLKIWRFTCRGK
jgi:hypothetical protein